MSNTVQEEAMMVADYSPGDTKITDDKENKQNPQPDDLPSENADKSRSRLDLAEIRMTENGKTDEQSRDSDSESNQESHKNKRKHRRRRGGKNHKKWKPYDKMSWSEKKELEEKETKRATQKREEAFLSGHPVAPYNTTQFLMEDHEAISPDLRHNSKGSNESSDSSSDFYEEDQNEGFQHKNFLDTFNDIRKQELMSKSKEDLVHDYVDLEMKLELMEELKHSKKDSKKRSQQTSDSSSSCSGETEFDVAEYLKLKEENEVLKSQNTELKNKLQSLHPDAT